MHKLASILAVIVISFFALFNLEASPLQVSTPAESISDSGFSGLSNFGNSVPPVSSPMAFGSSSLNESFHTTSESGQVGIVRYIPGMGNAEGKILLASFREQGGGPIGAFGDEGLGGDGIDHEDKDYFEISDCVEKSKDDDDDDDDGVKDCEFDRERKRLRLFVHQDLDFGRAVPFPFLSGTVTIDPATGLKTLQFLIDLGGFHSRAEIEIMGKPGKRYIMLLPGSATISTNTGVNYELTQFQAYPGISGTLNSHGKARVFIGATATVLPNTFGQAQGLVDFSVDYQ